MMAKYPIGFGSPPAAAGSWWQEGGAPPPGDDANWGQRSPPARPASSFTDLEAGSATWRASAALGVHWTEQARHTVLLLRLQRPYFVYCLMCSLLAAAAFVSTLMDLVHSHRKGELPKGRVWEDILEGGTWQSACWSAVGLALCAEVASSLVVRAGRGCKADCWCAFDAIVVVLTALAWGLTWVRRASPMREEAEEADLWLLMLRFALQPCRVLAAASMACKVQQMQDSYMDISFDTIGNVDQSPQRTNSNESLTRTPVDRGSAARYETW